MNPNPIPEPAVPVVLHTKATTVSPDPNRLTTCHVQDVLPRFARLWKVGFGVQGMEEQVVLGLAK